MAKFLSLDNLTRFAGVLKIGFSSTTAKTSLADADSFLMLDSADTETVNGVASVKKRKQITWANLKTELGNFFAANDALVFKGTLGTGGTVTALPTTHQVGWTYRVITAGTYLGHVCEVGDLIIALVDRSGSGNVTADWTVAQNNADLTGIPTASNANPLMDGTAQAGTATPYSREDHRHPTDTSRAASSHTHAESDVTNLTTDLAGKLGTSGVGTNVTVAFSAAANHTTNVASGESLGTLFGKVMKYFADLGAAAWCAIGTAAGTVAAGDHAHAGVYANSTHTHAESDVTNLTTDLAGKLGTSGNASSTTVAFSVAGTRALPATGETLATLMGKILKYFTDLGAAAYLAVGTAAGTVAAGDHTHSGYATSTHAHGNVTTDGKIGSTIDLPIITGTAGALIAGAWASDAEIDAIVV